MQDEWEILYRGRTGSAGWRRNAGDVRKCGAGTDPSVKTQKSRKICFYNCFHLKKLSFGGDLRDVGVGAMTGCHKIERVTVKTDENGDSCLRDILTELPETLRVDMDKNGEQGRFWFPEFLRKA